MPGRGVKKADDCSSPGSPGLINSYQRLSLSSSSSSNQAEEILDFLREVQDRTVQMAAVKNVMQKFESNVDKYSNDTKEQLATKARNLLLSGSLSMALEVHLLRLMERALCTVDKKLYYNTKEQEVQRKEQQPLTCIRTIPMDRLLVDIEENERNKNMRVKPDKSAIKDETAALLPTASVKNAVNVVNQWSACPGPVQTMTNNCNGIADKPLQQSQGLYKDFQNDHTVSRPGVNHSLSMPCDGSVVTVSRPADECWDGIDAHQSARHQSDGCVAAANTWQTGNMTLASSGQAIKGTARPSKGLAVANTQARPSARVGQPKAVGAVTMANSGQGWPTDWASSRPTISPVTTMANSGQARIRGGIAVTTNSQMRPVTGGPVAIIDQPKPGPIVPSLTVRYRGVDGKSTVGQETKDLGAPEWQAANEIKLDDKGFHITQFMWSISKDFTEDTATLREKVKGYRGRYGATTAAVKMPNDRLLIKIRAASEEAVRSALEDLEKIRRGSKSDVYTRKAPQVSSSVSALSPNANVGSIPKAPASRYQRSISAEETSSLVKAGPLKVSFNLQDPLGARGGEGDAGVVREERVHIDGKLVKMTCPDERLLKEVFDVVKKHFRNQPGRLTRFSKNFAVGMSPPRCLDIEATVNVCDPVDEAQLDTFEYDDEPLTDVFHADCDLTLQTIQPKYEDTLDDDVDEQLNTLLSTKPTKPWWKNKTWLQVRSFMLYCARSEFCRVKPKFLEDQTCCLDKPLYQGYIELLLHRVAKAPLTIPSGVDRTVNGGSRNLGYNSCA